MNEIVVTKVRKNYKKIIPTKIDDEKGWAFSFKFYDQIKFFGLDKTNGKWFISLIQRLKHLSYIDRFKLLGDKKLKTDLRFHEINWDSKNIPIKRKDLSWVQKDYLQNENEYPFYQFQISKANGRIVGFWNEDSTLFYVVLLDPLHNIQPSKNFNYQVDDCNPLSCEYTSLHQDIHQLISTKSNCDNCNIQSNISKVPTKLHQSNAIIGFLDDSFLKEYEKVLEKKSLTEILELGILAASE